MRSLIISLATAIVVFHCNLFLLPLAGDYVTFDASSLTARVAFASAVGTITGLVFLLLLAVFGPKSQHQGKRRRTHNDKILALIVAHATFSFEFVFYREALGNLLPFDTAISQLTGASGLAILIGAISFWLSYLNNRTKFAGDLKYDGSVIPNSQLLAGIVFAVLCIAIIPSSHSFDSHIDRQHQKTVARIYSLSSQQLLNIQKMQSLAVTPAEEAAPGLSRLGTRMIEAAADLRTLTDAYTSYHSLGPESAAGLPENAQVVDLRQGYLAAIRNREAEGGLTGLESAYRQYVSAVEGSVSNFRTLEAVTEDAYQKNRLFDFVIGAWAFIGLSLGLFWPLLQLIQAQRAALNVRVKEAESALVAKSQFLATMSHELRTPMNGVLGMVRLMIDSGLNQKQMEHANTALQSGDNLLTILNDILNYTKIESGQMELEIVPFSPKKMIQDSVSLLQLQAQAKGLELTCAIHNRVPDYVKGDPTRIQQVLINLLGNALKFTSKGSIHIKVFYKGTSSHGKLIMEVADTGVGIPGKAQARIFDHFSQADETITRKFGGTGLGLAISKQLVELMKGKIGVKSTEGFGSTFWFTIPVSVARLRAKPAEKKAPAAPAPAAPEKSGSLKILIAEDNLVNQQIICAFVKSAGHSVELVDNGEKAVNAVAEGDFDVVLMDIQMPVMDGVTATEQIRTFSDEKGQIPIVAVTANAMEGDKERYLAAGMNSYIAKPVNPANLNDALGKLFPEM